MEILKIGMNKINSENSFFEKNDCAFIYPVMKTLYIN
jgi:hypothetical protein